MFINKIRKGIYLSFKHLPDIKYVVFRIHSGCLTLKVMNWLPDQGRLFDEKIFNGAGC
jgi:hypothetical protein